MPKAPYTIKPYKHARLKYVVRSKTGEKWVRKYFESHAEAKSYVSLKTVELMNVGKEGVEFPTWLRVMAQHAHDQLKPFGKTIADAVEFYLPSIKARSMKRPVQNVVNELISAKTVDGASSRYIKDLRNRLTIFARAHAESGIADFNVGKIDEWLRALPHSAVTRNNYKRLLGVLFSFAEKNGYISTNPARLTARAKVIPTKPGILSIGQCQQLLDNSNPEILPAIALGLFAGLRPEAEVWRLDWSCIDLKEKLIDISKSKNLASDRFVTISANLSAWLKPYAKKSGPVSPTGDKYSLLLQGARATATATAKKEKCPENGIENWPSDCLRHTFASMHYAFHKNAGDTALQLGHGQNLKTFIRHYKNRVKPVEAESFWKIMPSKRTKAK